MQANRGELEFRSARVFIPSDLLPLACEVFSLANLHPMTRANAAVLRLNGQSEPIAGRFIEVAGTAAAVDGLSDIIADLGLPPALFAPVARGTFDSWLHPRSHL